MDIINLVRPNIRELKAYSSARDEFSGQAEVMLDANENPFNSPLNRYPDPLQKEIKQMVAGLKGTDPSRIFLGNGSDEAIDLLFRIFCEPGRANMVSIVPSYGMYRVAADINDIEVREVTLGPGFELEKKRLLEACDNETRLIFLCSPNNPTANLLDRNTILEVVRESHCIVVLDEAYIDFSSAKSLIDELDHYPNLVILQTFSKAWGLAGIRLGMAFASPQIIGLMNKVKYPYNISVLTKEAVLKALQHSGRVTGWVKTILDERNRLTAALAENRLVVRIWPSEANFILVRFNEPDRVFTYLRDHSIIVRDRSKIILCDGALRITVGTPEENNRLLGALVRLEKEMNPL